MPAFRQAVSKQAIRGWPRRSINHETYREEVFYNLVSYVLARYTDSTEFNRGGDVKSVARERFPFLL